MTTLLTPERRGGAVVIAIRDITGRAIPFRQLAPPPYAADGIEAVELGGLAGQAIELLERGGTCDELVQMMQRCYERRRTHTLRAAGQRGYPYPGQREAAAYGWLERALEAAAWEVSP